ncbi:hypothetical protein [Paraburkholderia sp.]|uniref:hypothetical protein n=1 Tax=Paraburkholderia sp. TaxID=1926495 RepID=UPI00286F9CA8|nr:hypothetical protein [Paraburkholderia sp.]
MFVALSRVAAANALLGSAARSVLVVTQSLVRLVNGFALFFVAVNAMRYLNATDRILVFGLGEVVVNIADVFVAIRARFFDVTERLARDVRVLTSMNPDGAFRLDCCILY